MIRLPWVLRVFDATLLAIAEIITVQIIATRLWRTPLRTHTLADHLCLWAAEFSKQRRATSSREWSPLGRRRKIRLLSKRPNSSRRTSEQEQDRWSFRRSLARHVADVHEVIHFHAGGRRAALLGASWGAVLGKARHRALMPVLSLARLRSAACWALPPAPAKRADVATIVA